MFKPVSEYTQQWLDWGRDQVTYEANIFIFDEPVEPIQTPDVEHLEADPMYWFHLAKGWMDYFNSNVTLWESVFKRLDSKYSFVRDDYMIKEQRNNPKLTQGRAEAMARVVFEPLREAKVIAENRSRKFQSDYFSALALRDMVSRSITARESDRRILK